MHRLLLGPYRSGKTGQLVRELVEAKKEYPFDRCLILVPSQRYGALVREKLREVLGSEGGMFGLDIATIYDACAEILRMAGEQQVILPRDLCASVVAMAVRELKDGGGLEKLGSISEFGGTSQAILRLLDEFERAALTPMHVSTATAGSAASDSKYSELAEIYKQYWVKLDALGCSDQKRMAYSCREILSRRDFSDFRLHWLIVDGFDRISPLQAEVIHALAQHATETHIAFDYIEPERRTEAETEEYSWKDSSFDELKKRFPGQPEYVGRISTSGPPAQSAFRTLDGFFEMQEVARRCKEAMLLRGVKPEQILVVARDIQQYATAARSAFDDARLPYQLDESKEYRDLPLFKLIMKVASLAQNEFVRREVFECLLSPFIDLDALGLKKQNLDSLDKATIDKGVVGGLHQWEAFLEKEANEQSGSAVLKFFSMVTPPETATVTAYCRWLEGIENVVIRKHTRLNQADSTENEAIQGLRQVVRTLVQQESLFGAHTVSYGQFLAMFSNTADGATYRRAPHIPKAILICAAEQAPNRRFDEIFVAGVIEGSFPKHTGESGFVSAEERARWATYGVNLANPREEAGFERALFKSFIERARKRIYFSLPDFTFGGEESLQSFFLTDGTCDVDKVLHIQHAKQSLARPASAREAVSGWLWLQPGIELSERLAQHPATEEFWQTINVSVLAAYQRHQKNRANAYNGYLVDLTQSHWLEVKMPSAWSASALNNYGQCPFKYWLTNSMGIEPRREPIPGLAADIRGKLYHAALEIFYSKRIPIQEAFEAATESLKDDPTFTPGPYWDNEKKEMLFRLNRFLAYDEQRIAAGTAQPAMFETPFGMSFREDSYPALKIDSPQGTIFIRGVIDRIDLDQNSATVIDYKSSSSPISLAEAQNGTNIQLPIYALAVERAIKPNAKVRNGHFLSINGAKSIGTIDFEGEKAAGLLDATVARIVETVASVKSGDFSVRPTTSKSCKTCVHKPVCRITDLTISESEEF